MRKDGRVLICVAVYMPHGIDLRLLEDGDIRRTQTAARWAGQLTSAVAAPAIE